MAHATSLICKLSPPFQQNKAAIASLVPVAAALDRKQRITLRMRKMPCTLRTLWEVGARVRLLWTLSLLACGEGIPCDAPPVPLEPAKADCVQRVRGVWGAVTKEVHYDDLGAVRRVTQGEHLDYAAPRETTTNHWQCGLLTKTIRKTESDRTVRTFAYDGDRHLLSELRRVDHGRTVESEHTWEGGLLLRSERFDSGDPEHPTKTTYTYDDRARLLVELQTRTESLVYRRTNTWEGDVLRHLRMESPTDSFEVTYFYNAESRLMREEFHYDDDGIVDLVVAYAYDDRGLVIGRSTEPWGSYSHWTYDSEGRPLLYRRGWHHDREDVEQSTWDCP